MDTRDLSSRDWLYLGLIAVGGFVLYKLWNRASETIERVGQSTGDLLYNLTHNDFVDANWQSGVRLPNGASVDVPRQNVNEGGVFPFQGELYSLMKRNDGTLQAIRSPAGTRYDYPEFFVTQQAAGRVLVTNK